MEEEVRSGELDILLISPERLNLPKGWLRLAASLQPEFWQRIERLTKLRQTEAQQMQTFIDLSFGEPMAFLIEALDGDPSEAVPDALTREAARLEACVRCWAPRNTSLPLQRLHPQRVPSPHRPWSRDSPLLLWRWPRL